MESVLTQLKDLQKKFMGLSMGLKVALLGAVVALLGVVGFVGFSQNGGDSYQYAFTNLTPEDATEAAGILKTNNIPFRAEANGAALAVPGAKVYDARLLLATNGLPRGGGVGFEIFDKGDIGMSEFTQKINLRRATEGELGRTLGHLSEVRSARVHISMADKGLFRDEDKKASAAVVLNLQPGRVMSEKELVGVRHLVASAVPSLAADSVTIMDGRGAVLSAPSDSDKGSAEQHEAERGMEMRIIGILEPVVGRGGVVPRVTADFDASEVNTQSERFDPDSTAVRSERKVNQQSSNNSNAGGGGIAGAAANQPLNAAAGGSPGNQTAASQNVNEEVHNYEISKTVTNSVDRTPRLKRISVSVLLDGKDGKPRSDAEVARLGELVKRAVGFDQVRGDSFDIYSTPFTKAAEEVVPPTPAETLIKKYGTMGGGALALLVIVGVMLAMRSKKSDAARDAALLTPGQNVAQLEASFGGAPQLAANTPAALQDPNVVTRDHARDLAQRDPQRTAHLVRAWISQDADAHGGVNRG